jgi:zinc transport system ATP-binding protein
VQEKTAVLVNDLSVVKAGYRILDRVSFRVPEGRFLGIVGPNGGGKTTLLRVVLGLEAPDSGYVRVFGLPPGRSREVGYLPQRVPFDPRFPVRGVDVVRMALGKKETRRLGRADLEKRIRWALDLVGMRKKAEVALSRLSGGEQQRIFLARALVRRPRLLVLDEPTLGVDAAALDEFMHGLERLRSEATMTLLMVSHEHEIIRDHTDEVLCVSHTAHFLGPSRELTPEQLGRSVSLHTHKGG